MKCKLCLHFDWVHSTLGCEYTYYHNIHTVKTKYCGFPCYETHAEVFANCICKVRNDAIR